MSFDKIAPYLQDPLVLAGFALFLFFALANGLIKSGLIPTQTQRGGFRILQRLLLYGFVLAIAIILLGFGLKYREMSQREQIAVGRLILSELKANRTVAGSLAANSATLLQGSATVAYVLRHKASPLLRTLFPYRNLEPDGQTPAPSDMAQAQLALALQEGLPARQSELDRMNAVARAVRGTLGRTRESSRSLADLSGSRYRISRAAWSANLPVARRIFVVNLSEVEQVYTDLEQARANYGVLVRYNQAYFDELDEFLAFEKNEITDQSLARALAAERQYFVVATTYSKAIVDQIETSGKAIDKLEAALPKRSS